MAPFMAQGNHNPPTTVPYGDPHAPAHAPVTLQVPTLPPGTINSTPAGAPGPGESDIPLDMMLRRGFIPQDRVESLLAWEYQIVSNWTGAALRDHHISRHRHLLEGNAGNLDLSRPQLHEFRRIILHTDSQPCAAALANGRAPHHPRVNEII